MNEGRTDQRSPEAKKFPSPLRSAPMLLLSCAVNVLLLAPALHLLQMYDRVLVSGSIETLIYITLIAAVALVFYALAEVLRTRMATRLSNKFTVEYADDIFNHLVYDRRDQMNANQILKDLNTVRTFIAGRQFIGLFDLPFFPLFLGFMFLLHPTLGLVAIVGICLMSSIALLNKRMTKKDRSDSEEARADASNFSLAVLRRTDDIRAMGLLPTIMQRWGKKTAASLNTSDQASAWSSVFYGLGRFVRQCLQVGVMAWGAYLVIQGDMSGGMMFAASMLLGKTLMPVEQLIGGWDAISAYQDAYKSVQQASAASQKADLTQLPSPEGRLRVENLVYNPDAELGLPPIVSDISFDLAPGEILAVVGPSGAGKSTIARLIVGAMAPTSGTIRLDGFDLAQWPEAQRGNAIGYVPQDITLFPGTIAENIARLEVDPDSRQIVEAAQMAGIHDMVARLPNGYGTPVGPGAIPLSGGQRQRIALARTFYTNPKVLILDEPNAHLDMNGERLLMNSMEMAKAAGVALLVISQRRSILKVADRVMVIVDGKVHSLGANEHIVTATNENKPESTQNIAPKTFEDVNRTEKRIVSAPSD